MSVLLFILVKTGLLGNESTWRPGRVPGGRWRWSSTRRWPTSPTSGSTTGMPAPASRRRPEMEARWLTVGPVQENTWIARQDGADQALLIDPGDEPERIKGALQELKTGVAAILITHCHFDHVGAVAEMARAHQGARSTAPPARSSSSRTSTSTCASRASGRSSPTRPRRRSRAATRWTSPASRSTSSRTPGHSPDHVTYSIAEEKAIFSGDVLFQGSIGRTDLPGADHPTLMRSIATLLDTLPDETGVLPGHMDPTTLGPSARPTRSCASSRRGEDPGAARHVRRPARRGGRARAARDDRGEDPRASGLRPDRDADVRGHAALQPDGGRGDRRRPEGDVHVPGRERGQPDAAAGGHRAGRALLPRARHAQGAAAGEALVPLELLPLRAPAGRPLPPVLADRGGGDRVRRPGRGRRGDPAARGAAGGDRRARREARAGDARPARRPAPPIARSSRRTCERTRTSSARTSSTGSTSTRCARSTPSTSRPSA